MEFYYIRAYCAGWLTVYQSVQRHIPEEFSLGPNHSENLETCNYKQDSEQLQSITDFSLLSVLGQDSQCLISGGQCSSSF
jgi:hypothetical protein